MDGEKDDRTNPRKTYSMRLISTTHRSEQPEIMDEFDFKGKELEMVLKSIDRINSALGGHRVTIHGVKKLVQSSSLASITIVDVGCGSGASLRTLAKWARKRKEKFHFTGIDANPDCIQVAKKVSYAYENINFQCMDVFSDEFKTMKATIFISTLTLHHFKNEALQTLIKQLEKQAEIGIVINDLHRSKIAYALFAIYAFFFIKSKVAKHDGLISILRGFKKQDFAHYSQNISLLNSEVRWFWAFRYQWIIRK